MVPEWRLLLAHAVGRRTKAMAKRILSRIKAKTDGKAPLFTSDRLRHYYHASWSTTATGGSPGGGEAGAGLGKPVGFPSLASSTPR